MSPEREMAILLRFPCQGCGSFALRVTPSPASGPLKPL